MFDLEPLLEFSRNNCVTICAFLVPVNLVATITTLVLVARNQAVGKIYWSMTISLIAALTMFAHVSSWFVIGVITPVTFILFGLGSTCLAANALAYIYRDSIAQLFTARFSRS
ncbi:hypothetical protein NIES4102_34680 [Chondrocystis sp. NIES-4102]|nr:hypothetical protein NIES4102_34680 [Chondrocystis sp. NIES-4102]